MTNIDGAQRGTIVYNPYSPLVRADPYPTYAMLRQADPIQFNAHAGIWFLTRHKDCVAVLRNSRFSAERGQAVRRRGEQLPRSMLNSDPPDHTRLRGPVIKIFTSQRVEEIRPQVVITVGQILDRSRDRGEMDILSDLARPLATRLFADLFSFPRDDLERFRRWMELASVNLDPLAPPEAQQRGKAASTALEGHFAKLMTNRRQNPKDDFATTLLRSAEQPGAMSPQELVTLCGLFVIGGYEPIVNLVGNGVLALLRHPGELRRLATEPTLLRRAVNELLRYDSPIQLTSRVATERVELDGHIIEPGQAVVSLLGAANRDPESFVNPDFLDLSRSANPHLAFGAGIHACLGAALTRMVGEVAFGMLLHRFPHLDLASSAVEWGDSLVPHGLKSLTVKF